MRTKRFDFNFRPLQINQALTIEGGVSDQQTFNADTGEYIPDYTLEPTRLVIQPRVGRLDRDEILSPGRVNAELTNVRWFEIVEGKQVEITDGTAPNASFSVVRKGENAGQLTVRKNAQPQQPINLIFRADYPDPRNGQVYKVEMTKQILCKNATTFAPELLLDAADHTVYNPLASQDVQVVHASLRLGEKECPAEKRKFVWEIQREDGTYSAVGDDELDYDVTISADGLSCTIDRSLMGDSINLRCRAKYSIDGTPDDVTLSDASPERLFTFTRRIPKFEYDITEVPTNINKDVKYIAPRAKIWDTNGLIDNAEKELLPLWYVATNVDAKLNKTLSYSLIGHGMSPVLPTEKMDMKFGAVYGLDVVDVGPVGPWVDSDGALIVDDEGNLILFH